MPILLESMRRSEALRKSTEDKRPSPLPPEDDPFTPYKDQINIRVEVGSYYLPTTEQRDRIILQGIFSDRLKDRPCVRVEMPDKQMLRFSPPPGVRPLESCTEFVGSEGFFLLRLVDDKKSLYSVQCHHLGANCRMLGYFRDWGFGAWVPYRENQDWDELHTAIQTFLAQHAVRVD
jgi:hypothetical protein